MTEKTKEFLQIKSIEDLAKVLDCKESVLNYYCTENQSISCYNTFMIKKKSGGFRQILAPKKQLKWLQRKLSNILYEIYEPKRIATGFIKNKNVVTNAEAHVNKKFVLNIDIENFFDSIHFGRVLGMFRNYPFNFEYKIAVSLSQLVCFDAKLPQGAPTSPIITNFICRNLDSALLGLSAKYKLVCTRYCDDISFSTKASAFPTGIVYKDNDDIIIGEELLEIFNKNRFKINKAKIRLQSSKSRQIVTGIVVNQKVNIPNKKYRKFRAILHNAYCNGLEKTAMDNKFFRFVERKCLPDTKRIQKYLYGTINYYKMVMTIYSSKYQNLAKKYNEFMGEEIFKIPTSFENKIAKNIFIIEDLKRVKQGTAFLVKDIGLVTCLHNVAKLDMNLSIEELTKHIQENIKVYLPVNERKTYLVSFKKFFITEDLLILDILGVDLKEGFEITNDELKTNKNKYISVGYPNYASGNTVDIMDDIKIRAKRKLLEQELYEVDKIFITGASGGPVFNQEHKVIGYIDRGNTSSAESQEISAFCSIAPLLKK